MSIAFQFDLKGVQAALRAANATAKALGAEIPSFTVKTLTEAVLEEVKVATPGSGRVRELWKVFKPTPKIGVVLNELSATEEGRILLEVLEGGSKPHRIRPIPPTKALHFFLKGGQEIFAKEVFHPGTRAYRMIERGEQRMMTLLEQVLEAAAEKAVDLWERPQ